MLSIDHKSRRPGGRRHFLALLFAASCCQLAAAEACRVIAVSDGDTLKAHCHDGMVTVRLAEIDAPEKRQPYGMKARRALIELCLGEAAEITPQDRDRYGRVVARVACRGEDAGRSQLARGLAWVFDRYVRDRSLYAVQEAARQRGDGLWADEAPIPPWQWRKLGRPDPGRP